MHYEETTEFLATIELIGVNPFVLVPSPILEGIMVRAGKRSGPIPVQLTIDGHAFAQTLVKYCGAWRLYLNGPMRQAAGKQTGAAAAFTLRYDSLPREVATHPKLQGALDENAAAQASFVSLPASRRLEIVRYIAQLKSEKARDRNVEKAVRYLIGQGRFIGREK